MSESIRRVLVIDDDTIVRQSIATYLEDSDFHVQQIADGEEGFDWLDVYKPDIVVTDLCMPRVNGLDVLKAVHVWNADTPVIVVSGMGVVRDVVEALRLGAADYLVKPLVDMEVLVHSIKRALERGYLLEENRRYREELEEMNSHLQESVRTLERDHQAGRQVQSKILPQTPVVKKGLEIGYKLIPSLYLSGDFIDYGLLANRYFAFYLTDVSGHGAASAFVTVWLKQLVTRCLREQNIFSTEESFRRDAGTLLKLINREILQTGMGCHLTCFVGVIDTQTYEMRYVVAGHLPLPLLITDQGAEYLQGKGKPIGIFSEADWEVNVIHLPSRFTLIAFSDGILEVLPKEGLIAKEAYLRDKIVGCESLDTVTEQLNIKNLETAPDDIAILKIRSND